MTAGTGWLSVGERGSLLGMYFIVACHRLLGRRLCAYLIVPVVGYFFVTGSLLLVSQAAVTVYAAVEQAGSDARIIAATNKDVQKMVDEGKFREDLWYRLNVVRINVPPLCERASDIPLLVQYRFGALEEFRTDYALNVSVSGMFISTSEVRPVGTRVFVQLTTRDGAHFLQGEGRVVRVWCSIQSVL